MTTNRVLWAGLAMAGAALALRARELRVGREHASRMIHTDLLKMAMEDQVYARCWGPYPSGHVAVVENRQAMYVNLILSYWESRYEMSQLGDAHLREAAARMFQAEPGRQFWEAAGPLRIKTARGRRARRFHQILDEEYRIIARNPPHVQG